MKQINNFTAIDAKNIFSLEQITAGINRLKEFQWPKFIDGEDIDEFTKKIKKIITTELGPLPNLTQAIPHKKVGFSIFRAREIEQIKNNQLFTEFSYPPISVTSMGRCNFPNYPVFYASNSPLVAILEVLRKSNYKKRIYLSSWSIIPSEDILYFESFLRSGLNEKSLYNSFNTNIKGELNKSFNGLITHNQTLGVMEYLKFLDQQFITDETYSVSAALAHRRLYLRGNFGSDIIMYPSVQSKGNDANLVINPNFVENNMKLNRVYIISLQDYDFTINKFSLSFHRFGQVNKNSILWNDDMKDKNFKKAVASDFGPHEIRQ